MRSRFLCLASVACSLFGCGNPYLPGFQPPAPPPSVDASAGLDASADFDAGVVANGPPTVCTDAGSSAAPGACEPKFASGLNVAWVNFASDVPNPDLATFDTVFGNTYQAGGRVIRWWFHVDGRSTPGYGDAGDPLPATCSQIADVRHILDHAASAKVMVLISLWSFNMLDANIAPTLLADNTNLLTVDATRQAYIDSYLKPLVAAVAGHPGLYGWEIFNEPEGMSNVAHYTTRYPDGGPGPVVDELYIQKTINWFADAIHGVDPGALVTNGTWQFRANSDVAGTNYYSDSALVGAGGRDAGVLDFYEVHYYSSDGASNSPFKNAAAAWMLDKPIVIGEFDAIDTDGVSAADLYTALHGSGYGGALAWKYLVADDTNRDNNWPSMQVPMQNLYSLAPKDIDCP
jgi:hypothetical protein